MRPLNVEPLIVDNVLMLAILPRYLQMHPPADRGPGGDASGRWQRKWQLQLLSRIGPSTGLCSVPINAHT
jgi:hypothetical protein